MVTNDFETFWLTATNIVLGLVTLVCCIVMTRGLFLDIKARLAERRAKVVLPTDDHAFVVPALGLTMADGGERLDKKDAKPTNGKQTPAGNEH